MSNTPMKAIIAVARFVLPTDRDGEGCTMQRFMTCRADTDLSDVYVAAGIAALIMQQATEAGAITEAHECTYVACREVTWAEIKPLLPHMREGDAQ